MNWKILTIFLTASILILYQFITTPNIINGNDLNGNIVPLIHFKESITKFHQFPQWNAYINQGIPTVADPLYGIYNPIIGLPILFFEYQTAVKITYFLSVLLCCIAMYLLTRSFKILENICIVIALTFASSSYIIARITAGHIEKIVSYAFLPLFLLCILNLTKKRNLLWAGATAIVLTLILFTGDIYNCLYCLYSLGIIFLFYVVKDKKVSFYLALAVLLFTLFSSIKILPMIELQSYISKIKEPFVGGLNILSFMYNLFLPFDSLFGGSVNIQTGFGWWESLVFIGPISILGLYFIIKSAFEKHVEEISILIVLNILFVFLATPNSPLNPLHYLVSLVGILQYFHVPSRILALWGVVILLTLAIFVDKWKNKNIVLLLLVINLSVVFIFSQFVFATRKYSVTNIGYINVLHWIKNNNPDNFYIVHRTSQNEIPQDIAYQNHILLLQSNYGLFIKGSLGEKYNFKGNNPYTDINPGFILSDNEIKYKGLKRINYSNKNIFEYKYINSIPFAKAGNQTQTAIIYPNQISLNFSSTGNYNLTLLETYYPGWNVYIDGVKQRLLKSRFLGVKTIPGQHEYKFVFSSTTFNIGFIISVISFSVWILISFRKINKFFHF